MSKFDYLTSFKSEIEKCNNKNDMDKLIDKIKIYDINLLTNISFPAGWNTLKEKDLQAELNYLKEKIGFAIELEINRIPNINIIKNIQSLINEGKNIDNAPNKISPFVRKVNNAVGKEIDFPNAVLSKLNTEDATNFGIGGHLCRTNKEDLDGVIIRLENYLDKLSNQKKDEKTNAKDKLFNPIFNILATADSKVENNIDINISIENKIETTINEIEKDDNLNDAEIAKCKQQLEILKQSINDNPKIKWEKCKSVFSWLGDKTIKFGKWFIPIMAEILINKATTPTT
ncbi:MAG: hypothetical protein WCQ75_00630 [Bacilli bacterium]